MYLINNKDMKLQNKILTLLQDPENRKIVNEGQDEFSVDKLGDDLWVWVQNGYNEILEQAYDMARLTVYRYCIKLLPEFQVENPRYKKSLGEINGVNMVLADFNKTLAEALLKCGAMTTEELETEYERLCNK
jgi:hypothetical protein